MSIKPISLIIACLALVAITMGTLTVAASRQDYPFTAKSGELRKPLIELYTSEGCSSCPPTEHWVQRLGARQIVPEKMLALALHVDYWDYIGWEDPYGKASNTQRQRAIAARNRLRTIYTPQLVLNGEDFRSTGSIESVVDRINHQPPGADLQLHARYGSKNRVELKLDAKVKPSYEGASNQIFVGLTENDLVNDIGAGENAGRTLTHEHVVRQLAGPFDISGSRSLHRAIKIPANAKHQNLALVAFVQNHDNGEVMQALRLPLH